jgi:hypothetical protein
MSDDKTARESEMRLQSALDKINTAEIATSSIMRFVHRCSKIEDPVLRFSLITQLVCMSMDMGISVLLNSVVNDCSTSGLTAEDRTRLSLKMSSFEAKITNSRDEMEKLFDNMTRWIATPNYSPDRPFGEAMMKTGEASFKQAQDPSTPDT